MSSAERVVAVVASPVDTLPDELALAMCEDVVDLVAETPQVGSALLVADGAADGVQVLAWPGTPVVDVPARATVAQLVGAVATSGGLEVAVAVAVVCAAVPDLPGLLLGKLFSAISGDGRASVAVCPDDVGGVVAVAARLPVAGWLEQLTVGLDDTDALQRLRRAAPTGGLVVGPGWHRVRREADLDVLDTGLEGWAATRSALAARR